MSIYIENDYSFDFDIQSLADDVLDRILADMDFRLPVEVNIVIADDAEIREVNNEYRGIDRATDVLSFPSLELTAPVTAKELANMADEGINPDTGELMLGDMMISYDRIVAQAAEYGHSIKRELAFLITHSILHLLGYDHESDNDEKLMREKQTEILNGLDIRR